VSDQMFSTTVGLFPRLLLGFVTGIGFAALVEWLYVEKAFFPSRSDDARKLFHWAFGLVLAVCIVVAARATDCAPDPDVVFPGALLWGALFTVACRRRK